MLKTKILIVDDQPANLHLLEKMLSGLDLEIIKAYSGIEALELTKLHEFALVLLDVRMPGWDGFETAGRLRADPITKDLSIIFVTAYSKEQHQIFKGYEFGAVDYLIKPLEVMPLRSKVQIFCNLYLQKKALQHARDELEVRVKERTRELRSLASKLVLTEERERRKLAIDLHDSIGQSLAIARIKLNSLTEKPDTIDKDETLNEVNQLLHQIIQHTRSLTFELSPPILYELGFEAALESLAEQMDELYNLKISVVSDQNVQELEEDMRVLLFRTSKELLMNIVKHAKTETAQIYIESIDGRTRVTIEDEGVGFNVEDIRFGSGNNIGFGLFSIRERMHEVG